MKSKYIFKTNTIRAGCCLALLTGMLTGKLVAQGLVEMSPGTSTEITGMIHIETNGQWLNQGTLSPGNSTLLLNGEAMQILRQDGGAFHHLTINKGGGDVSMVSNINIHGGTLSLLGRDMILNGHLILLDAFAVLNETTGNTVKGPVGYLSTTRTLSSPANENVGGLGLIITSEDNFGSTEIRRGHGAQSANGYEGILRYYDVFPEFNVVSDATLQLRYDESELNGNTEAQLKMYRSPDGGTTWIEVDGVLNATDNCFDAPAVNSFSRFTLSSYCLETCINVECQDATISLNESGIVVIDPLDLLTGDPDMYAGYTFNVEPDAFSCMELGEHQVTLTSTAPSGEITICIVTVTIDGPDADCDGVADQCDVCDGGDDLFDTDGDGIPDCADWDGWAYLIEEWQCANNKVFVCHNGNVICVNKNAVSAHLNHGDFLGPCDAVTCDDPPAYQTGPTYYDNIVPASHMMNGVPKEYQVFSDKDADDEVLIANHPNPFFPQSTIRFYLPDQDWISLVVYDMMGAAVSVLAKGAFDSGWHEVIFDGTNQSDGVYIYMLRTSRYCETGTMVLAR